MAIIEKPPNGIPSEARCFYSKEMQNSPKDLWEMVTGYPIMKSRGRVCHVNRLHPS